MIPYANHSQWTGETFFGIKLRKLDRYAEYSLDMLQRFYCLDGEVPNQAFVRAALAWSDNLEDAQFLYDAIVFKWFMWASPVLANAPTPEGYPFKGNKKGMPISCFLQFVPDTVEGLLEHTTESRMLSVTGAASGAHWSGVRGVSDKSPGPMAFLPTHDADVRAWKQGKVRRGAYAAYLSVDHPDFKEFLRMRIPTGDITRKCLDLHHGVNLSDDFMHKLKSNAEHNFIDPHSGKIGDSTSARKLWREILTTRGRTGEPFMWFIDNANRAVPEIQRRKGLKNNGSNLCVAPETLVLTDKGYFPIKDLENQVVQVWNGEEWSEAQVAKTGTNQELMVVHTSTGDRLECTFYHKFYVQDPKSGEIREVRAKDLVAGDILEAWTLPNGNSRSTKVVFAAAGGRIDDTYCVNEPKRHKVIFNGILTGNCSEISLVTDEERTAVCCLSSPNAEYYDEWRGTRLIKLLTRALDNVLTYFIDNAPEGLKRAKFSAQQERSIGIGMMGLHYWYMKNHIGFTSDQAFSLNEELFSYIKAEALAATRELAREKGEFLDGIIPVEIDLVDGDNRAWLTVNSSDIVTRNMGDVFEHVRVFELQVGDSLEVDGQILTIEYIRADWHEHSGRRNAHLLAPAPNASSALLLDTSPAIEGLRANIFSVKNRAGSIEIRNRYLEQDLELLGRNTAEVWKSINAHEGSIQHFDWLSDELKETYATFAELDMLQVVEQAIQRQKHVCQSQSLNLYFPPESDINYVSRCHIRAWEGGLKGIYYYRTSTKAKVENVGKKVERKALADGTPFTIYGTAQCTFCVASKALLDAKGIKYNYIDLHALGKTAAEVTGDPSVRSVPVVVYNGKFIGGYKELVAKLPEVLQETVTQAEAEEDNGECKSCEG